MRAHLLVSQIGDGHVASTRLAVRRCDEGLLRRFIPAEADDVRRLEIFQYKVKGLRASTTSNSTFNATPTFPPPTFSPLTFPPTLAAGKTTTSPSTPAAVNAKPLTPTATTVNAKSPSLQTPTTQQLSVAKAIAQSISLLTPTATPARRSINPVRSMILYDLEIPAAYTDYDFPSKAGLFDLNLKTRITSFSHLHNKYRFVAIEKLLAWQQM
jgi:hypothetical protein